MFLRTSLLQRRTGSRTALTALALCSTLTSCSPERVDIVVTDARVRALIPGQDKTVGYFDITNSGTRDLVLISARSSSASSVELHTITRDDQMLRMRRLEQLKVPAGATVEFRPGGNHLMLFGVAHLEDKTEIELITAGGRTISAAFRQIPAGADG